MEENIDNIGPESIKYDTLYLDEGTKFKTVFTRKYKERKPYIAPDPAIIKSFIPGTIRSIFIKEGQSVNKGDELLTLEAMKMVNELRAPISGIVKKVHVKTGQIVANKELLIELQAVVKTKEKAKAKAKPKPKAKK